MLTASAFSFSVAMIRLTVRARLCFAEKIFKYFADTRFRGNDEEGSGVPSSLCQGSGETDRRPEDLHQLRSSGNNYLRSPLRVVLVPPCLPES